MGKMGMNQDESTAFNVETNNDDDNENNEDNDDDEEEDFVPGENNDDDDEDDEDTDDDDYGDCDGDDDDEDDNNEEEALFLDGLLTIDKEQRLIYRGGGFDLRSTEPVLFSLLAANSQRRPVLPSSALPITTTTSTYPTHCSFNMEGICEIPSLPTKDIINKQKDSNRNHKNDQCSTTSVPQEQITRRQILVTWTQVRCDGTLSSEESFQEEFNRRKKSINYRNVESDDDSNSLKSMFCKKSEDSHNDDLSFKKQSSASLFPTLKYYVYGKEVTKEHDFNSKSSSCSSLSTHRNLLEFKGTYNEIDRLTLSSNLIADINDQSPNHKNHANLDYNSLCIQLRCQVRFIPTLTNKTVAAARKHSDIDDDDYNHDNDNNDDYCDEHIDYDELIALHEDAGMPVSTIRKRYRKENTDSDGDSQNHANNNGNRHSRDNIEVSSGGEGRRTSSCTTSNIKKFKKAPPSTTKRLQEDDDDDDIGF